MTRTAFIGPALSAIDTFDGDLVALAGIKSRQGGLPAAGRRQRRMSRQRRAQLYTV